MIPPLTLKMNLRNRGVTTAIHLNWNGFSVFTEQQDGGGTGWKNCMTENKCTHKRALTKLHHMLGWSYSDNLCFQQRAEEQPSSTGQIIEKKPWKNLVAEFSSYIQP